MIHISIIIPTRNRSLELRRLLDEVSKIKYPKKNYEVIVVNNNSSDNSWEVAQKFINENPDIKCKQIFEKKLGPSFARNKGVKIAKYKYAVFIDDDVSISDNLLLKYKLLIQRTLDLSIAAGKIKAISKNKNKLLLFKRKFKDNLWVFSESARSEKKETLLKFPDDLISANLLVNLSHFKGPLFNTKYGRIYSGFYVYAEDLEFILRALLEGKKVIYAPSIISRHIIDWRKLSYKYIFKSFFRAGVEKRMLDNQFKNIPGYISYKFDYSDILKQFIILAGYHFPLHN